MIDNNVNEKWISIDDAAEYLGVKPVTIRDWIRKGKDIPAHKIGKQWKFKCSELDAWVKSGHSGIILLLIDFKDNIKWRKVRRKKYIKR